MAAKKESIELHCSHCNLDFRLWIPYDVLPEWENGVRVNCIRCGAQYFIKKGPGGFESSLIKEIRFDEKPVATVPVAPPAQKIVPEIPSMPERRPINPAHMSADTVIIVEDDRLSREMAENTLKDLGMRLVTLKNATEAVKFLRKEHVSLIVTDLYLKNPSDPESLIDGEEMLKRIADSGLNIPAIITTGKDIIDDLVLDPKWFDLHVKGFIQKGNPFWAEELKLKIKEVLYKG
ncbi:MAG: response regulator [Deltaproteobacteria bacterium]|nr:response regulator [Deltaproteobacteria bacterium]